MLKYQVHNIVGYENANISFNINVTNTISNSSVDLTGYMANGSFKKHFGSANSYVFTTNGYSNGLLVVSFPASNTANLEGRYLYDIRLTESASNNITRIQDGILTIKRAIT